MKTLICIIFLIPLSLFSQYSIQNIHYETDSCDGSFELNVKGNTFPLDVFVIRNTDTVARYDAQNQEVINFTSICSREYEIIITKANSDKARERLIDILSKRPNTKFYDLFVKIVNLNLKNFDSLSDDVLAKISGYSDELLKKLDGDLPSIKNTLNDKSDLINIWNRLIIHRDLRKDADVLKSYDKALANSTISNLNLDDIISNKWVQFGFGCKTCATKTKPWISELLEHLTDFSKFKDLPGAETVIARLTASGKNQAISANWVMKYVKRKGITPTSFEDLVDEVSGDFTADIVADGVFIECKSWGSKIPNLSNVPSQMINYFNAQPSLSKFKFEFDPERWVPTAMDLNEALKANKNLFNINKWTDYTSLFGNDVNNLVQGDFDGLIDIITSKHFSKIINP